MVLLQVGWFYPTPSTTTRPATFAAENIALKAMHIIMQVSYVFYVHYSVNFVHTHTQQKYTGTAAAAQRL